MNQTNVSNPKINEVTLKVVNAARDTLGPRLEKVILFGSYARGDYDEYSDVDICVLADVPNDEVSMWHGNIRKRLPLIDLDYDITVCIHVTDSALFKQYANTLPYFMNIEREGVPLYA